MLEISPWPVVIMLTFPKTLLRAPKPTLLIEAVEYELGVEIVIDPNVKGAMLVPLKYTLDMSD